MYCSRVGPLMTLEQAMASLKAAGSEKTRKTYARHCVTREMFGVSYGDLEKLRKAIKTDHALAQDLWRTGNHDARTLALMIADPAQATIDSLGKWAAELDHSLLASGLAKLAGKTKAAKEFFEKWHEAANDRAASSAWTVLAVMAMDAAELADDYFERQ